MYRERYDGYVETHLDFHDGVIAGDWDIKRTPSGYSIPDTSSTLVNGYQTMHELSSPAGGNWHNWNSFSHYRRDSDVYTDGMRPPVMADYYFFSGNEDHPAMNRIWRNLFPPPYALFGTYGSVAEPFYGLPPMYQISASGDLIIPPPTDLESLLDSAHQQILPGIRPRVSCLNFIYELKDFKHMTSTFSHVGDTIDRIGHHFDLLVGPNHAMKTLRGLSMREIARRAADLNLQYRFNFAPLLSDLKGIFKAFKSYKADLHRQVEAAARVRTRHYKMAIPSNADNETETSPHQAATFYYVSAEHSARECQVDVVSHRTISYEPAKFHVEMQFYYLYSNWQRDHVVLLALMDELGVNFNPQIIWNAIPWSFVVDWVVNVGSFLKKYGMTNLEPVMVIQRSLWSIHRRRHVATSVDYAGWNGIPCSSVYDEAYRRQPYEMTSTSIQSSGLSLDEIVLGGSLLLSRRRRH